MPLSIWPGEFRVTWLCEADRKGGLRHMPEVYLKRCLDALWLGVMLSSPSSGRLSVL